MDNLDEVIFEKQSRKARHRVHKKWRKNNRQKSRDQAERHKNKHPNQAKRREETRQKKEKGLISKNPSCATCGSKENVQYDHQKGYGKGAPSKPLCHKHHTKRPQQNKKGEKSVRGGTVKSRKKKRKKKRKKRKRKKTTKESQIINIAAMLTEDPDIFYIK